MLITLMLLAIAAWALPLEERNPDRMMNDYYVDNGIFDFTLSNYGIISSLNYLQDYRLLYQSGIWISGKRYRKDDLGRQLYWLHYPPQDANDLVYEGHELWNPDLVAVQDTLSSIGVDGDDDLHELLPAYNPLNEYELPSILPNAAYYYENDRVLESLMGVPAPIPFDPFNSETFCFSIAQEGSFETPGFITHSAYFYDYCPFGTEGDRDYGSSSSVNTHYPLGLAVHQETYSWPVQDYYKYLVQKHVIYNTNAEAKIEDLAISHYFDADMGPASGSIVIASDDKSGFVKGEGYEFAYSRDANTGFGQIPYYIASKVYIPNLPFSKNHAWYWRVGDGPDDYNPLNYIPYTITANQKYWLATGRNPDPSKYTPLRPENPNVDEYEQPSPNDTRVLNTLYGAQPGMVEYDETDNEGNYLYRLSLEPHESITFYVIQFVGDSLDDLKTQSQAIESFIDNDFYVDPEGDLTSIPYLKAIQNQAPDTFVLNWFSMTNPHHFEVAWKEYGQPASQWNIIEIPGDSRNYNLSGMNPITYYEIKVGAVYYNPDEVYLESRTLLANLTYIAVEDELITAVPKLTNYPNPFSGQTRINFELDKSAHVKLDVYNSKGQKVRNLSNGICAGGLNEFAWDTKDDKGRSCASGVYYLRMKSGDKISKHKLLLIK
jgi:hypothetical protein